MPLSGAQSAHLCRRVGFSGTNGEISHFSGREAADVVDEILAVNPTAPSTPGFLSGVDWWEAVNEMRFWWVDRMIDASWVNRTATRPSPLEEKMTLFWHSHFASGIRKVEDATVMWKQNNLLRNRGRGSLGTLLDRVCTHGALLRYLDNDQNTASEPQENFARELMELYTIGPDNFTESDVIEMTRAWTGHGVVGWLSSEDRFDSTYEYSSSHHDKGTKVLFGTPAQKWNGPDTLPLFISGVRSTETARFIATKLWRFFVNDSPTTGEINDITAAFLPGLNITDALRAILLHPTFWESETEFALVRSPVEIIVQILRQLNIDSEDGAFIWQLGALGHELFEPPSVAGWGTGDYWVGTGTMWAKAQWLISLSWNEDVWSHFDSFLDEDTAADGADLVINQLRIPSPSAQTRAALESLWQAHQNKDSWYGKYAAMILGCLSAEMQVA